jgi:AGZA family xanthine/uracil permease-like MFS transporter
MVVQAANTPNNPPPGTGPITYGEALAAVFLEGIIFFVLTILGLRQWMARLIPRSITLAIGAGIGLFLTVIGLSSSGLNVISGSISTPVGLAGCPAQYTDPVTGFCNSHVLQDGRVWLGIFAGGVVTAFLMLYRVKGALLWPIFLVSIISWPRPTNVTAFPHTVIGDSNFDFFKQVVAARPFKLLGPGNVDWSAYSNGKVWIALVSRWLAVDPRTKVLRAHLELAFAQISFLYVDLLDTTGTLVAMSKQAGLYDQRDGDFEGSSAAFLVDSGCIAASGLFFGCSPCTPFVGESLGRALPHSLSLARLADPPPHPLVQNPHPVSLKAARPV